MDDEFINVSINEASVVKVMMTMLVEMSQNLKFLMGQEIVSLMMKFG